MIVTVVFITHDFCCSIELEWLGVGAFRGPMLLDLRLSVGLQFVYRGYRVDRLCTGDFRIVRLINHLAPSVFGIY